jgi:outer membrane receptor protein involved in Fe transport
LIFKIQKTSRSINTMNSPKIITTALALGLCALPPVLHAQAVTQEPSGGMSASGTAARAVPVVAADGARPLAHEEDIVRMSVFTVSEQADTGYQALNTLAGTRLNTPLKDIGASISVYTKDFMDDIGAVDAASLLAYATNMEVAGANGNYSAATDDINSTMALNGGQRANPQGTARTRGLAAPNITRNYFSTNIAFDTYNTGPVTIARGPNAILFGVGSPAGVVDTALSAADTQRTRGKAEVRYGNNDSLRFSLNHNQVLLRRRLALRVAVLDDKEKYNQEPAFEHKRRVYGAVTFTPSRTTEIRANFEAGKTDANRPIGILPFNSISSAWLEAGMPAYDWRYYDDPDLNPNAANEAGGSAFFGNLLGVRLNPSDSMCLIYDNPAGGPTAAWRSTVPRATTTNNLANALHDTIVHPLLNRDGKYDGIHWLATGNLYELPDAWWTPETLLHLGITGQQPGIKPAGIRYQGFTDYDMFNFARHMIDETSRQGDRFHTANIALSQTAWRDRLGVELVYDRQHLTTYSRNRFFHGSTGSHVRVDTSATLTTGQPNPNLGRPFVINWEETYSDNAYDREGWRATVFARFDFREISPRLGAWLGRHTLTGVLQRDASDIATNTWRYSSDGLAAQLINANIGTTARRAPTVVYLGPSILDGAPLAISPVRVNPLSTGPTGVDALWFSREAGATDPGHFESTPYSTTRTFLRGTLTREVIDSTAFSLHSYWLDDHLITLAGVRWDRDYFASENTTFAADPDNPNDPGRLSYSVDDMGYNHVPPFRDKGMTGSLGVVLRWPRHWLRLPGGSDVSVFHNQSDNFTPAGARVDGYGRPLAAPEGKTKEFGIQLWALGDRVSLRLSRFETKVIGQSFSNSVLNVSLVSTIMNVLDSWAIEGNNNPHLVDLRARQIQTLLGPLPSNFTSLYHWRVVGEAPALSVIRDYGLANQTDTTDTLAKGYELDLVFNPARGLRIMANVAMQETTMSNIAPFLKGHIARMADVWLKPSSEGGLADVPRTVYPTNWQIGAPLPSNTSLLGPYVETNVMVPYRTLLAQEGSVSAEQRKWRANLIVSYSFSGRGLRFLKGLSLGAAARWQDRVAIGYPSTRAADGSVTIHLERPYHAPAQTNMDAWISYEKKFHRNRCSWKIQLNVRNLIGNDDPIPVSAQPWGEIASTRIAPERRWYCANTFSF